MASNNLKNNKHNISALAGTLNALFAVLIVLVGVIIFNQIKESKYIGQDVESKNTITVSATGEVYTKPDLALTTFSVTTEEKTIGKALSENTEKMNAVINYIKEEGVESKDLKTTNFSIYPRYEWYDKETCLIYYSSCPSSGKRVLVGYEVTQSLQVKIRSMEKIGSIIEGAVEEGANQIGDLQFTVDQEDDFKNEAREQAIEKAKEKAKNLASQLEVDLVRIVSFSESSVYPIYYSYDQALTKEGGVGGAAPEVETGENKIESTVNITYEIN
ncbi:MAG: SIMPL domain-containing protein [Candidatus Nealsonbacteria bacterium]